MSSFDDPELLGLEAREAVVEAIRRAIERGVPIVYSEGGRIYREFADGHRVECERTDPSVTATLPALGFVDLAAAAPAQPETPGKRIVRIFAGPNGSGKSTIYEYIARRYESGYFINPDRINLELEASGRFSFANLPLQSGAEEVRDALRTSSWGWEDAGAEMIARMTVHEGPEIAVAGGRLSYAAAIIADVVRHLMIREGRHFSIETVMSHPSKIEFMWEARRHGYTCYLYYVCTD